MVVEDARTAAVHRAVAPTAPTSATCSCRRCWWRSGSGCSFVPVTISAVAGVAAQGGGPRLGPGQHLAAGRRRARPGDPRCARRRADDQRATHHAATAQRPASRRSPAASSSRSDRGRGICRGRRRRRDVRHAARCSCAGREEPRRRSAGAGQRRASVSPAPTRESQPHTHGRRERLRRRYAARPRRRHRNELDPAAGRRRSTTAASADELERRRTVTRLGAGVDADGRLSDEAMQRVYDDARGVSRADRRARRRHGARGADQRRARRRQRPGVRRHGRDRYGLEPHMLTGEEEARLTFLGATSERDPDDRPHARDRHRRRLDRARDRHRRGDVGSRFKPGGSRAPDRTPHPHRSTD